MTIVFSSHAAMMKMVDHINRTKEIKNIIAGTYGIWVGKPKRWVSTAEIATPSKRLIKSEIIRMFIDEYGIDVQNVEYVKHKRYGRVFKDTQLTTDFYNYHAEKARYKLMTKGEHRQCHQSR